MVGIDTTDVKHLLNGIGPRNGTGILGRCWFLLLMFVTARFLTCGK